MVNGVGRDIEEVRAREEDLRAAMLAGDVETLSASIDDRLVFTAPGGAVIGKAQDLSAHATGLLRLTRLDIVASTLHSLDGLVVATARAVLAGTYDGKDIGGVLAYTRVWSKSSGRWRVIAGHANAIDA